MPRPSHFTLRSPSLGTTIHRRRPPKRRPSPTLGVKRRSIRFPITFPRSVLFSWLSFFYIHDKFWRWPCSTGTLLFMFLVVPFPCCNILAVRESALVLGTEMLKRHDSGSALQMALASCPTTFSQWGLQRPHLLSFPSTRMPTTTTILSKGQ